MFEIMKNRIIVFICVICLLLVGFGFQPQPVGATGNIYYVAKTGSDTNNGSLSHPWLTINHAAATAMAGDTVEVETGTYNEYVFDCYNTGTAANPITFENYPGESPVIDGTGLSNPGGDYGLLYIAGGVSYINWIGFTIQNSQSYQGIYVLNSSYINLTNMVIHDTKASGIKLQGSGGYITINNCQLYNCNTGNVDETLSIMPMSNVVVENCYLHNNPYDGISIKNGCSNVTIHNNEITTNGSTGIYVDCQGTTQNNIQIYDNEIHDLGSTQDGIELASEVSAGTLTNCNIYNNLFYNITGYAIHCTPYDFDKTISIINNTIYNCTIGISFDDPSQYQINCVVRNNIIYSNITNAMLNYAGGITGITTDHNLFYNTTGTYNVTTLGTNYIEADPLFVSPTTNFALQTASPAIDSGSSVGAPSTDYIGTSRPQGAGYDIGAYEFVVPNTPSIVTNVASNVTINTATLNGNLTTLGNISPVTVSFDWGTDTSYSGGNIVCIPSSISSVPTAFTAVLSGLSPGTTYHYRAKSIGSTTVYGNDQQFTTLTATAGLSIVTSSLPNGTIGVPYSQTLVASGGTAPYNWTTASGTLPSGLSLSSIGIISGTPTAAGSSSSITFTVTDSNSSAATTTLAINVIYSAWDVNMDGSVNILDIILVTQNLGETGTPGWIREDVNDDGVINVQDAILVGQHFN